MMWVRKNTGSAAIRSVKQQKEQERRLDARRGRLLRQLKVELEKSLGE